MSSAHDIGFEIVECESDAAGGGEAAEIAQTRVHRAIVTQGKLFGNISEMPLTRYRSLVTHRQQHQRIRNHECSETFNIAWFVIKRYPEEIKHQKQDMPSPTIKNDQSYDCAKVIVPIDHQDAVAAMKKNDLCVKDNKSHESEVEVEEVHMEEPLEEVSAEFQPQTPGVAVKRKSTNQCANLQSPENSGGGYSISSDEDTNDVPVENEPSASKVQSTLNFTREKVDVDSNENFTEINRKLDILLQKLEITSNEIKVEENKDMTTAVTILKEATCLADIDGFGFKFYPGEFDGGRVRCEICFEMICEKHPALLDKLHLRCRGRRLKQLLGILLRQEY